MNRHIFFCAQIIDGYILDHDTLSVFCAKKIKYETENIYLNIKYYKKKTNYEKIEE